jgi:hypothetical protein
MVTNLISDAALVRHDEHSLNFSRTAQFITAFKVALCIIFVLSLLVRAYPLLN